MLSTPTVSAIIPFLNAGAFLEEAIESVFAQTYRDWELLLVDDGSTDASTALARRYAERYGPRARYLEHDGHANRGVCASRNLGIKRSHGKYLAFLDGDVAVRRGTFLRVVGEVAATMQVEQDAYVEIVGCASGKITNRGTVRVCGHTSGTIRDEGFGRTHDEETIPEVIDAEVIDEEPGW